MRLHTVGPSFCTNWGFVNPWFQLNKDAVLTLNYLVRNGITVYVLMQCLFLNLTKDCMQSNMIVGGMSISYKVFYVISFMLKFQEVRLKCFVLMFIENERHKTESKISCYDDNFLKDMIIKLRCLQKNEIQSQKT